MSQVSKKIIKAYIIGKKVTFFVKQIQQKIPYLVAHNLKNAVDNICSEIKEKGEKNCTILFSPAAASFDQFRNFEDRGNQFKTLIKQKEKIFLHA